MLYSVAINNSIRFSSSSITRISCYRSTVSSYAHNAVAAVSMNQRPAISAPAVTVAQFSTKPPPTTTVSASSPATTASKPPAPPATKPAAPPAAAAAENEISPITERRDLLRKMDRHLIYYNESAEKQFLPAPTLPENIKELTALDSSDVAFHNIKEDGSKRMVYIRQMEKNSKQSPLNPESCWRIYFYEDGTSSERWENPLMGWTSNADPYQTNPPITFETAADAVYFAKKCGWNYYVHMPILRVMRDDNAQYQDNFLKPAVVLQLQKEGVQIKEWARSAAATSHYFRPLNYHGTQPVRQHGPTGTTIPIAPHVPGIYKKR